MRTEYSRAAELPDGWDALAGDNIYLKRDFLEVLERSQKTLMYYYCFFSEGKPDSMIVYHKSRFDMNMFTKKRKSVKTFNMVYPPISVSRPSLVIGEKTKREAEAFLKSLKGWSAVANTEKELTLEGFSRGYTCPRCVLEVKWGSFDEYMSSLRSGYRRRYNKALGKSAELTLELLEDNSAFDGILYGHYLEVLENSRIRLETLQQGFFRENIFKIIVAKKGEKKLGFLQLLENGDELIFEFIGFDHSKNAYYDIYHRFLLEIVRYGIDRGFKTIDFGQTADDAKLKLGCKYVHLYTHLRHSFPPVNAGIKLLIGKKQYKFDLNPDFHVFRDVKEPDGVKEER